MSKLYAVGNNPKPNPSTNPYRDLAITVALTAAVSTATTMLVQWTVGRAKRARAQDEAPPQQQMLMGYPGFGQPMPMMAPGYPPMMGPGYPQPMMPPGGMMWLPQPAREQQALPVALQIPASTGRQKKSDSEPAWFSSFRKEQENWRRKVESSLLAGDDEDEDEEDVG